MLLSSNKEVTATRVTKQVSNLSLIKELSAPIFKWVEMSDPPMLVNHIKWPGGGGSQKVNHFLSETFFHHLQNSFPPDWWCNMWATPHCTSPKPSRPKVRKGSKRGALLNTCCESTLSPSCPASSLSKWRPTTKLTTTNSYCFKFSLCSTLVNQKPLFGTKWPNRKAISTQPPGTRSSTIKCLGVYLRWAIERC